MALLYRKANSILVCDWNSFFLVKVLKNDLLYFCNKINVVPGLGQL